MGSSESKKIATVIANLLAVCAKMNFVTQTGENAACKECKRKFVLKFKGVFKFVLKFRETKTYVVQPSFIHSKSFYKYRKSIHDSGLYIYKHISCLVTNVYLQEIVNSTMLFRNPQPQISLKTGTLQYDLEQEPSDMI